MNKIISALSIITLAGLCIAGCQGSTSGDPVDLTGGATQGATGSLSLLFTQSKTLTTGTYQGFRVVTKDSSGVGIPSIRVTCDTENGLSLIEPTAGYENTDSNGEFSGKVGCNKPGSWLMICRLPSPSGVRDAQSIVCQGDRPAGFTGWSGAAGGGLGGGNGDNTTLSGVRVSSVLVSDTGDSTPTTSIDITQGGCVSSGTVTPEPFHDSSVKFTVVNNSPYLIQLTSMTYTVANADGTGASSTSGSLDLTASASASVDANGGTGTFDSLLFQASSGTKKVYNGATFAAGFKNVTFTLSGQNELGEKFTVKTATALSFANFNRCTS